MASRAPIFGRWTGRFPVVALAALLPIVGGCWAVIGESFTGYSTDDDAGSQTSDASDSAARDATSGDAGDATTIRDTGAPDGDASSGDASDASAPHQIDDCGVTFVVSNGIGYPDHAPAAIDLTDAHTNFDTTPGNNPSCVKVGGVDPPYCLFLASSIHVAAGATLGVFGNRPLVVMAVHDITVDATGTIDVSGSDGASIPGPGDPTLGVGQGVGSGGGNADIGGGTKCSDNGGPSLTGLVAGGIGGGPLPSSPACQLGGAPGGAVQIVSLCGTISFAGAVAASGGAGGGGASVDGGQGCPEGAGGGAGGTVWFQSGRTINFTKSSALIQLTGGGGGGGACRDTATDPWTPGQSGTRFTPGAGATCTGGYGGYGGDGGANETAPLEGTKGTGDSQCGGGGGARGRLVIQAPGNKCGDISSDGTCSVP